MAQPDEPSYIDEKKRLARELFHSGANCAQAVLGAFQQECGLDLDFLLKASSGFGGGFGRLREVCGAASGLCLGANLLFGYSDLSDKTAKDSHYAAIQRLLKAFQTEAGALTCRELLGLKTTAADSPVSSPRTADFYTKRPCASLVELAAGILAEEICTREKGESMSRSIHHERGAEA